MPKKGKKGKGKKKGKKEAGPEIRTTRQMIIERSKMLCPRMGDNYTRTIKVEEILENVVYKTLEKCADKKQDNVCLAGMKLSMLPNFFQISEELYNLVDINLSRNQLFNGDHVFGVLSQLEKLKKLNLSCNALNGVLHESVGDMKSLEVLHLDSNQLTGFPSNTDGWTNLKTLTASDNFIKVIPEEAIAWVSVVYINLRNNKIEALPGQIVRSWTKIERLYLSLNKIKELPDEIGYCQKIVELDMCSNVLDVVPSGIAMCTQLVLLNLAANKIATLPTDMFSTLVQLRDIQLYKNKLTALPPEIGNLKSLRRLSLSSNNLRALPEEIGACTSLRELYINNNAKFSVIPGSAGHLRQLQELSARKCPALKQLPATAQDMVSLRELDLRAQKKQVCKIAPEVNEILKGNKCIIRGGVVKKGKGKRELDLRAQKKQVCISYYSLYIALVSYVLQTKRCLQME
eukprot:CAMPEP_0185042626 /NCGR_PEP_ID=MMETSP1103-20130426/42460_1 /TAXON_ID=36769 /ORGANISM="Paraphysomonas bandaiensis, Strain Caron Lab Isolate" /LENGTH=458 /DNA_ID=CAMNT_0027582727 /DNA_START=8 /DNA_END=1384 /DNA_ORIENTATION=+